MDSCKKSLEKQNPEILKGIKAIQHTIIKRIRNNGTRGEFDKEDKDIENERRNLQKSFLSKSISFQVNID